MTVFENDQDCQAFDQMLEEAVEGTDLLLLAYCGPQNHLFFELTGSPLKPALENFKNWTGGRAGRVLNLDGERFWQGEWFDHWSRSDEEDERIIAYIRRNP